jgi:hypothetical protein
MKLHTIGVTLGAAVLTTAMLTGGALAASADSPAPTSSSQCEFGQHLVEVWTALPANLQADLKNLKNLPQGERAAAAKEIRQGALDGKYGPGVQKRAERVQGRAIAVWGDLPAELQDDLKAVKAADPADRPALAKALGEKALAGGYGDKVQAAAEKVQSSDFWQNCVAG